MEGDILLKANDVVTMVMNDDVDIWPNDEDNRDQSESSTEASDLRGDNFLPVTSETAEDTVRFSESNGKVDTVAVSPSPELVSFQRIQCR